MTNPLGYYNFNGKVYIKEYDEKPIYCSELKDYIAKSY